MSVSELFKSALPVAANFSPLKNTPLRVKQQVSTGTPAANEKMENIATPLQVKGKTPPKPPEEFYKDLQQFHERRGTPIMHMPKITGRILDLHRLYSEVTERGGFLKVNIRDEWEVILPALGIHEKCVNASAAVKHIYRRCLEKYERLNFFGEDPDKIEALEAMVDTVESGRSRARYPSTAVHNAGSAVPMTYNYRQHVVNMDRRRMYGLSTDLHKGSPYEKLMLSLISPLPNEQDFAINICTLMANESKPTLKLNEHPKVLDVLLAHTGVFPDYSMRKLFQHVYTHVRRHSLLAFWRDLLHDKPQILELYTDEQTLREAALVGAADEMDFVKQSSMLSTLDDCMSMDFLNLGRGEGIQDYVGLRVQQVINVLHNLSFFDENILVFAKNRTFLRFILMSANIRWGNLHIKALDIAGNVATELELFDPVSDELTRSLIATLCDGIEGMDRAVIISSLEILCKLCQKDSNEEHINKCLNLKFYQTVCQYLSLNDIMLLIFTLEAIYALTSMGARSCHFIMQVRGVIDQLVSLITVEAQSYGPDGCILMRVVETVPGNMLPMVAQNIANLQNVAVVQKQQQQQMPVPLSMSMAVPVPVQPQTTQPQQPLNDLQIPESNAMQPSMPEILQIEPPQQQQSTAQPQIQTSQHYSQEDEQYALAWLGATFERAVSNDSHIEQQELYRMYLSHCQKSGKHSVVNHMQFPRLVRLIYNNSVGPVVVRCNDGTELPGLHYVAMRLRAQPLPIQSKSTLDSGGSTTARKLKRKFKPVAQEGTQQHPQQQQTQNVAATPTTPIVATTSTSSSTTTNQPAKPEAMQQSLQMKTASVAEQTSGSSTHKAAENTNPTATVGINNQPEALATVVENVDPCAQQQQPTSSLIKSLLANKVNQRQQKQKELTGASSVQAVTQTNVMTTSTATTQQQQQPIKVTSTAISALVNNPLMQNTPVKVGQTTIKPLNPQVALEKKPIIMESPPPLAPLSGSNVAKDASGRPVIIANQMLVEILDKKTGEPPIPTTIIKRKMDDNATNDTSKRMAMETTSDAQVTPSKNAANLYAEMAASILEDEELDDIPPMSMQTEQQTAMVQPQQQQQQQQSIIMPAKVQQTPTSSGAATLANAVQRQLVFQTNQTPQLKLTHTQTAQQIPTAMATIKTDQGLQTVPVILQQKTINDQTQPQLIQQMLQQSAQQAPTQTQYVLATNPQGQTYLVAQQSQQPPPPPQPQQTVLVTQTPQQQSAGTKTIIILQQQPLPGQQQTTQQLITSATGGTQKMIMTTPQGQQVLVTQRAQTPQQYYINPQTGAATHIQHVPVSSMSTNMLTTQTHQQQQQHGSNLMQRQLIQASVAQQQQQQQLQHTGQISPSLLSQLNHIPATIKLHQPVLATTTTTTTGAGMQPMQQQHQQASISRIGKSVSIVQGARPTPLPIQIPQLQQHQSIIQQHIISGPSEKRQVLMGGGRAIEIKEATLITPTQTHVPAPPQQTQLNAQTIITTAQPQQQTQLSQQQQQQQSQHPSIIQQKITVPLPQQQPVGNLMQTSSSATFQTKPLVVQPQSVLQTIVPQAVATQATITTIKKPQAHMATISGVGPNAQNFAQIKPQQHQQQLQPNTKLSGPPPLAVPTTTAPNCNQQINRSIDINPTLMATMPPTATTIVASPASSPAAANPTIAVSTQTSAAGTSTNTTAAAMLPTTTTATTTSSVLQPQQQQQQLPASDVSWLYFCEWRNCPRRKHKSSSDLLHHACTAHCPDHLDAGAEIYCQWGLGPTLCDGIPRKRYSLMTHFLDRHMTPESLRAAVQRRLATGAYNLPPTQQPVTIVRSVDQTQRSSTASPALSTSSSSSLPSTGSSAMQAIKRHTADFVNAKELMDENEGPVTKSIRLTAALILRNLVTYNAVAKRNLRRYEPHLANVALSNVESSGTISHILFELNN